MFKAVLTTVFFLLSTVLIGVSGAFVGFTVRTDFSTSLSPVDVVRTLSSLQINHVLLLNSDANMLKALSNLKIEVAVSVTNEEVIQIGKSASAAALWVQKNVNPYYPSTNITSIAVGNEILTSFPSAASVLVNLMQNLHSALLASQLTQVKVSTPQLADLIPKPFPPSAATFNSTWKTTIVQMLQFLKNTNSFYMLNAYPYYGYLTGDGIYPIDFALFLPLSSINQIVDPNTLFHYTNMLDVMVDAVYYAIQDLKIADIPVVVTRTGWPWSEVPDNIHSVATLENAETFNNNLIKRVSNNSGPPGHWKEPLSAYIYELYVENEPLSGMSWGVVYANGSTLYSLEISVPGECSANSSSSSVVYCVARVGASRDLLLSGLDWACGEGQADCSSIQDGKTCFLPDTPWHHASFAYNDYYQRTNSVGGTCDFNGTGVRTCIDPSNGTCKFTTTSSVMSNRGTDVSPTLGPSVSPCWSLDVSSSYILALVFLIGLTIAHLH